MTRYKIVVLECDDCGVERRTYTDSYKRAESSLTNSDRPDGPWEVRGRETHYCPDCSEERER